MSTTYTGIDYGHGRSNIDNQTGIRFGVISQYSVSPEAFDDVWQNARDLSYESAVEQFKHSLRLCKDKAAIVAALCDASVDEEEVTATISDMELQWGEDKRLTDASLEQVWNEYEQGFNDLYSANDCGERDWLYESDGYKLTNCLSTDVMVLASPYFTYAQFCSPCVPGACNLDSPLVFANAERDMSDCPRAYCLGHDYFEGGRAPYPVYSVATGELIQPDSAS